MKQVNSITEISNDNYLIKYGQEFCMPCSITEDNLLSLENNFSIPFYSTMNVDEAIEKGFTTLPVIILKTDKTTILNDTEIMMDEDELNNWIIKEIGDIK